MAIYDYVRKSLGSTSVNVELTDEDIDLAVDFAVKVYKQYGDFFYFSNLRIIEAQNDDGIIDIPIDIDRESIMNVIYTPNTILTNLPDWLQRLLLKTLLSGMGSGTTYSQFGQFFTTMGNLQDLNTLLGNFMTWYIWNGQQIRITPHPKTGDKIGIVYYDINDFSFLENNYLFIELVLAKCKSIIGAKYQKYSSLPGTNADITLYQGYYQEGEQRIKEIIEEIKNKNFIPPLIID